MLRQHLRQHLRAGIARAPPLLPSAPTRQFSLSVAVAEEQRDPPLAPPTYAAKAFDVDDIFGDYLETPSAPAPPAQAPAPPAQPPAASSGPRINRDFGDGEPRQFAPRGWGGGGRGGGKGGARTLRGRARRVRAPSTPARFGDISSGSTPSEDSLFAKLDDGDGGGRGNSREDELEIPEEIYPGDPVPYVPAPVTVEALLPYVPATPLTELGMSVMLNQRTVALRKHADKWKTRAQIEQHERQCREIEREVVMGRGSRGTESPKTVVGLVRNQLLRNETYTDTKARVLTSMVHEARDGAFLPGVEKPKKIREAEEQRKIER